MFDDVKRAQHLSYLKAISEFTRSGVFWVPKVYVGCEQDLQQLGLITDDLRLTEAGKAVLWYQHIITDPLKA